MTRTWHPARTQRSRQARRSGDHVVLALLACTLAIVTGIADTASAQTTRYVATTGADAGDCQVDPCATIQFAVGIAAAGDTILVAAGTYEGRVSIETNSLTLRGAGAEVTTINGSVGTSVRTDDRVIRLTLEGFTISGDGTGAGLTLNSIVTFGPVDWVVRGNIIRGHGNGIDLASGGSPGAVIENNVIANNRGHGIYNTRHPLVFIRNNTIVANGRVGYREEYGPPVDSEFVNNIVAFNGTAMTDDVHPAGFEAASPDYHIAFNNLFGNANGDFYGDYGGNCCRPIPYDPVPGTGEISVDPLFVNAAIGDYRLSPGSPSIDAGTNDNAPATDLDGRTRPLDGDADGTAVVDMGAFEAVAPDAAAPVVSASARVIELPPGFVLLPFRIRGLVTDDSGVNLTSGTFSMTDEYGRVEPAGIFSIGEDGRYEFVVMVEPWRRSDDADGRHYVITVSAADNSGNVGVAATTIRVRKPEPGMPALPPGR